ncbi:hypothetical protein Ddc_18146 [Ditylenchus destructor]|nr:hypothetical protein Ddc_18146 [Ditylenchus destructor]
MGQWIKCTVLLLIFAYLFIPPEVDAKWGKAKTDKDKHKSKDKHKDYSLAGDIKSAGDLKSIGDSDEDNHHKSGSGSYKLFTLDTKQGNAFAKHLNKKRATMARGATKFKLRYAAKMYKSEWDKRYAEAAKKKLSRDKDYVSFVVRLRDYRSKSKNIKYFDAAIAALNAYIFELVGHGIKCDSKKCEAKKVDVGGGKLLTLPWVLAYAKVGKFGCAIEYWKNSKSVKAAGSTDKVWRGRMVCVGDNMPNKILWEVGKPCTKCESGHKCDKGAGLCMTRGFIQRHPNGHIDK